MFMVVLRVRVTFPFQQTPPTRSVGMSDTGVVGVRGVEHCEVGVPAQVDTNRVQGCGSLVCLMVGCAQPPNAAEEGLIEEL
jgi:hypothetical protein